jgi:hypothetical protein
MLHPPAFLEVLAHHGVGVGVVILWIYVNLAYLGLIQPWLSLKTAMTMGSILLALFPASWDSHLLALYF